MDTSERIETALRAALCHCQGPTAPPTLLEAMRHAVFSGGARIRPRLCLAVAGACGDDRPSVTEALATSIELMHCASLVHDDLPCFDDAETRRGRPSVHRRFGEPLAVLAGDALIVLAFETLGRSLEVHPARAGKLISVLGRAAGSPLGLVAGQAWESEAIADLGTYHRAKTGSLFAASTVGGALAAGADPGPWRALGDLIGEAYQVADDLKDAVADPEELGKPVGVDAALCRPSAVRTLGVAGAVAQLQGLIQEAIQSIPDCPGADVLRGLVELQVKRLIPKALEETAA